jgi:hypothetical protein
MELAKTAKRVAGPCIMAIALAFAGELAAQAYQPESFAHLEGIRSSPPLALGLSGSGILRALDDERLQELRALEPFRGGKRAIDRFSEQILQRPKPWTLYGRLGVLNFQNALEPSGYENGMKFTLRSTGPRLNGRIYIGIHREF